MRRLFAAAAVTVLSAACGGQPPVSDDPGMAVRGETLVYGAGLPFRNLNPVTNEWSEASAMIVSRLFTINLSAGIDGDLVESHEVSDDGLTWTLRLRPDVRWHDGRTFSSDDVLFTFTELMKPTTRFDRRLNLEVVDRFEAPDPRTFVLHLTRRTPMLTMPLTEIGILPRHVFEGRDFNDDEVYNERPVGTGPYRLVDRRDGEMELESHGEYHHGTPGFRRIVLRHIADDDERAEALMRGEVEITQVKPNHVPALHETPGVRVYRLQTGAWRGMPLNLARPALQDRRVRRAISLAIDREAMVEQGLDGMGAPAWSPIPPANWAYPRDLPPEARDPGRAAQLLDEAGWLPGPDGVRRKDGRTLDLDIIVWQDEIFRRTAAGIVKANLEPLGFQVTLHHVDNVEYNRLAQNMGEMYDTYIGGWGGLIDPGDNLSKKYRTGGSQNRMGYSNPALDRILDAAREEEDREKAAVLYRQAVDLINEDAVFLPVAYPDYVFAAHESVAGMAEYTVDSWYEFTRFAWRFSRRTSGD